MVKAGFKTTVYFKVYFQGRSASAAEQMVGCMQQNIPSVQGSKSQKAKIKLSNPHYPSDLSC